MSMRDHSPMLTSPANLPNTFQRSGFDRSIAGQFAFFFSGDRDQPDYSLSVFEYQSCTERVHNCCD